MTSSLVFRLGYIGNLGSRAQYFAQNFAPRRFDLYNQTRHAGHAKWQNIKNTKQANDLAKGKLISRYVMMVRRAIVSQNMQTDPKLNSKLADVLSEAGKLNVPKATLERAIVRSANVKIKSVNLEVQGPKGCSLILKCETDNPNFLRREVKKVVKKFDSNLMPDDTLINMFKGQGTIRTECRTSDGRDINQDFAEEAGILANVHDVCLETYDNVQDENLSQVWAFTTDVETVNQCKGELEKQGFKVISSDVELVPYREVDFGLDVPEKVESLQKALRELDQVVDIYHNVAMNIVKE